MMGISQVLAIIIFVVMFVAIIIGKVHRYIPALVGAGLMLAIVFLGVMKSPSSVVGVINVQDLVQPQFWWNIGGHLPEQHAGINWQTIIFIAGMMLMVEGLGDVGFFRWLCLNVAKMVNYKVVPILITFMLLSGFLAMFIDSITVLLFLASVTVELARLLKFDPVPVIIAEIFAANTGGAATMAGDPPNIIIGTAFGYSFTDFLFNTGPAAWAGMVVTLVFFYFVFRRLLSSGGKSVAPVNGYPKASEAISDRRRFAINVGVFLMVIFLLITHAQTGMSVALIGVIAGISTLLSAYSRSLGIIRRFDWRTILFFVGLFVVVAGLEETGFLKAMANYINGVSGGSFLIIITIILWLSAFASAIVDNIPFAATMVPVISSLSQTHGLPLAPMSWSLALGTDIGGNGTPIGASANVVGTAIAEREGYPVGWGRFLKYALPAMILVIMVCQLYLVVRYIK